MDNELEKTLEIFDLQEGHVIMKQSSFNTGRPLLKVLRESLNKNFRNLGRLDGLLNRNGLRNFRRFLPEEFKEITDVDKIFSNRM